MTGPFPVVAAALLLWGLPRPAEAHGALEGLGSFYAGLLHPVVVPAETVAVIAVGLLLGGSGVAACRAGVPAVAAGIAIGIASTLAVETEGIATMLLFAVALVAAAIVTAGVRFPARGAVVLALIGGAAVGVDAGPEADTIAAALAASVATILGGSVLTAVAAALALQAEKHWQRIAARVAGSWISAGAILYLAWQMAAAWR